LKAKSKKKNIKKQKNNSNKLISGKGAMTSAGANLFKSK
jgi:hypothetical protein